MFARPNSQHCQVAYVTNDLDAAIEAFGREYDAPAFYTFTNANSGSDENGEQLRIALARVNGVEIELIEPIGNTAPVFSDVLPGGDELAIRFHHICFRIDGPVENWDAHIATLDFDRHPIVFKGALDEMMRFIYTDERRTLGHYVEHVWLAPEILAQIQGATPAYPPASA